MAWAHGLARNFEGQEQVGKALESILHRTAELKQIQAERLQG